MISRSNPTRCSHPPTAERALRRLLTPDQANRVQAEPQSIEDLSQLSQDLSEQLQVSPSAVKAGVLGVGFRGEAMTRIVQKMALMSAVGTLPPGSPLAGAIGRAAAGQTEDLLGRLSREEPEVHSQVQAQCRQEFAGSDPSTLSLTIFRVAGEEFTGVMRAPDPHFWG